MSQHHARLGWSKISAELRPKVAATLPQPCIRCGRPVTSRMQWDLGHRQDISIPGANLRDVGPEHQRCNRSAGGRAGAAVVHGIKGKPTVDLRHFEW